MLSEVRRQPNAVETPLHRLRIPAVDDLSLIKVQGVYQHPPSRSAQAFSVRASLTQNLHLDENLTRKPRRISEQSNRSLQPLISIAFKLRGNQMESKLRTAGAAEGRLTGANESQTAKIPSSGYLAAAIASIATSAVFKMMGRDQWAMFVGQWAPTFLILGVYNKMVKQHGTDYYRRAA